MSVLLFIRLNILAIFTGHELQTRAIKERVRTKVTNIVIFENVKTRSLKRERVFTFYHLKTPPLRGWGV
jgi:ribosomal protein S3AE